jgi:hypothetical protein
MHLAKTRHCPHSSYLVNCVVLCIVCVDCVVLCIVLCKCVLYYCHRVSTQLQLNISYHISKKELDLRPHPKSESNRRFKNYRPWTMWKTEKQFNYLKAKMNLYYIQRFSSYITQKTACSIGKTNRWMLCRAQTLFYRNGIRKCTLTVCGHKAEHSTSCWTRGTNKL